MLGLGEEPRVWVDLGVLEGTPVFGGSQGSGEPPTCVIPLPGVPLSSP